MTGTESGAPATSANRRTLSALRGHLLLTSLLATASFAAVIVLAVFVPLGAQLDRADVASESAIGLADHFLFLHSALWPVIGLALLSCVVSATVLYQRMRSPLVRFMRVYERVERNERVEPIRIRNTDYLSEEERALNRMIIALERRRQSQSQLVERLAFQSAALADAQSADPVEADREAEIADQIRSITKELESIGAVEDEPT